MSDSTSTTSMNEHLSALLDDEVGSFEERRILDELKSDKNLSNKLASYALIGESIRTGDSKQNSLILGSSFLDSIHEKIANEDQFDEVILHDTQSNQVAQNIPSTQKSTSSWLRPIGGFALAASVGALSFFGLQNAGVLNSPVPSPDSFANNSSPTTVASANSTNQTIETSAVAPQQVSNNDQYIDADAQTRSMLKRYVDSHMQYATTSTFVPSVRVIAYTDNQ